MRKKFAVAFLLATSTMLAQMPAGEAGGICAAAVKRTPYYVDPLLLDLSSILPLPPTQDSETTKQELAYVHTIEQTRTPTQVAQAQQEGRRSVHFYERDLAAVHEGGSSTDDGAVGACSQR
jgi:hypothetical protein